MHRVLRWLLPFCIAYAAFAPGAASAPLDAGRPTAPEAPAGGAVNTCTYWALRTAMAGGGTVTFNCSGTIVFTETWTVSSNTIIDGNGFNVNLSGGDVRFLFQVSAGTKLTLRRLTVRDGYNDNIISSVDGGCMRVFGALDLITVTVRDCRATATIGAPDGGAIFASGAVLQFTNTQVYNNLADGLGGAVYAANTSLRLHQSVVRNNTAYGGGGLYHSQGSADLEGSSVLSNTAQVLGGGIYAFNVLTYNVLSRSELSYNRVTSGTGVGGGAYFTRSRPYIDDASLIGNVSDHASGAIYVGGSDGTLALYDSVLSDNVASGNGPGGVHMDGSSASIYGNEFRGNNGYPYGGALRNSASSDTNSGYNQFVENNGYYGGGIYNDSGRSIQVYATEFVSNTAAYGAGLHNDGIIDWGRWLTFTNNTAVYRGGAFASDAAKARTLLTDVVMLNNRATVEYGAGIFARGDVTVTVHNAVINNNVVGRNGGGIYMDGGRLRLRNVDLNSNTGLTQTSSGVGLHVIGAANTLLDNVRVNGNQAGYVADGAAMHLEGAAWLNHVTANDNRANNGAEGGALHAITATVYISNTEMRRNTGMYSGGGIYVRNATLSLSNVALAENAASAYGGGIFAIDTALTMSNTRVTDHNSGASSGAGVYCNQCTGHWRYSTFSRNIGDGSGGGLYAYRSELRIEGALFSANGARDGGGLDFDDSQLRITNTTFSGNWATEEGGGIYAERSTSTSQFTLTNVTLKDNSAVSGGSIYIEFDSGGSKAAGHLRNTVLADPAGGGNCAGKPIGVAVYSLSTDYTCPLSGLSATNKPDGTPAQLGGLGLNGGWNRSHMPITGSVLIDGVTGAIGPIVDQRGASRPQGLGFDIGAVEFGVSVPNLVRMYSAFLPATRRGAESGW